MLPVQLARDSRGERMSKKTTAAVMPTIQSLMFNKPLVSGFWPGCLAPTMHQVPIIIYSTSTSFHLSRCPACGTGLPPLSTVPTSAASSSFSSSSLSTSATSGPLSSSCWTTWPWTVRWGLQLSSDLDVFFSKGGGGHVGLCGRQAGFSQHTKVIFLEILKSKRRNGPS